jgi:hypothetical protein
MQQHVMTPEHTFSYFGTRSHDAINVPFYFTVSRMGSCTVDKVGYSRET